MAKDFRASGFGHCGIGNVTSRDGHRWEQSKRGAPVVDLGGPGSPDEVQAASPAVLAEAQGFRMWYAAWSPRRSHTICAARSVDGIRWERENGSEPVRVLHLSTRSCQAHERTQTPCPLPRPRGRGFSDRMVSDSCRKRARGGAVGFSGPDYSHVERRPFADTGRQLTHEPVRVESRRGAAKG